MWIQWLDVEKGLPLDGDHLPSERKGVVTPSVELAGGDIPGDPTELAACQMPCEHGT